MAVNNFTLEDVCQANHRLTQAFLELHCMVDEISKSGSEDLKLIEALRHRIWDAEAAQKLIFAPLLGDFSLSNNWSNDRYASE